MKPYFSLLENKLVIPEPTFKRFDFSKGDYHIVIAAYNEENANKAWQELQDRNYYPTGRVWNAETNSVDILRLP